MAVHRVQDLAADLTGCEARPVLALVIRWILRVTHMSVSVYLPVKQAFIVRNYKGSIKAAVEWTSSTAKCMHACAGV